MQYNFDMTGVLIFAVKGIYVVWEQQTQPQGMVRQIYPEQRKQKSKILEATR